MARDVLARGGSRLDAGGAELGGSGVCALVRERVGCLCRGARGCVGRGGRCGGGEGGAIGVAVVVVVVVVPYRGASGCGAVGMKMGTGVEVRTPSSKGSGVAQ